MKAWRTRPTIPLSSQILLANRTLLLAAKNGQDTPTARAISERITKIKNLAKINNGDVVTTPKKTPTKTTTPRKRGAGNASTPGSKRSRTNGQKFTDSPDTVNSEYDVKDELGVKKELTEDDNEIIANNPLEDVFGGKRVRTVPALPLGMVRYDIETDDDDKYGETSGSEYAPAPAPVAPVMPTENGINGHFMEYA